MDPIAPLSRGGLMDFFDVLLAGSYNVLYVAGFVLAFTLAVWQGKRNGTPLLPWLALLAAVAVGGIAGSKLLHFDLHAAGPGEKTILGGIAGGMLLLLIVQRFLRFPGTPLAVLAPAALVGFALGRVGCFIAGCCFGRPTTLPWGVTYGPGSEPYTAQLESGLIDADARATVPVHPTQLYEAGLALLLAAVLWRWGGRLRGAGSPVLALGVGYGLVRFGVEFFRAGGAELYGGLKPVQWTVLFTAAMLAAVLVWREWQADGSPRAEPPRGQASEPARVLAVLGVVLAAAVLGGGWFTPLERTVLVSLLLMVALLLLWEYPPLHRWPATPGLTAVGLVLIAPVSDTVPRYPYSYFTVGGGGMAGSYVETCGPARRYQVGGVSAGYTHAVGPSTRYSVTGQAFGGSDRPADTEVSWHGTGSLDVRGVGLMGRADMRYVGLGLGAVVGRLPVDGDPAGSILPAASLRLGRLDRVFVEGRLLDHHPAAVPAPVIQLGIGIGLDERNSTVRVGVSDAGFYGGGNFVTPVGLEVDPFVAIGDANTYQVGIGVRQRVGGARR